LQGDLFVLGWRGREQRREGLRRFLFSGIRGKSDGNVDGDRTQNIDTDADTDTDVDTDTDN
jgi:hypothetical protein